MSQRIEDYALIGDTHTAALVGRDGSIDWLCVPRFDSGACFAALLGVADNGRWLLAPREGGQAARRSYRGRTLVLDQEWDTPTGTVRVTDFMPIRHHRPRIFRVVECLSGTVNMVTEVLVRFEYGSQVPWVLQTGTGIRAVAGPDEIVIDSPVPLVGEHMRHQANFVVREGDKMAFRLQWSASYDAPVSQLDPDEALANALSFWEEWYSSVIEVHGEWEGLVCRSLLTLKALTYAPSGGIVAAPTTSLPEQLGGARNWDYRYCWVRDATLTLDGLIEAGFREEAEAWLWWLVRAAAGNPAQLQIMYGVAGERRLPELEVDWLAGYESSVPVRIGNAASLQFQLDVFGELMEAVDRARAHGVSADGAVWDLQRALIEFVEDNWDRPDQGIWELRGPPRPLVYSRVMAWVAIDRAIKAVEQYGFDGPVDRWRKVASSIREQVCSQGFSPRVGSFVQSYGSDELDASLLMLPLVGFLPIDDPRVVGTIEAVQQELTVDGFVARYKTGSGVDGLAGEEGTFLPCTLWLVSCLALLGRTEQARRYFERVVSIANDVGLLSEEYDTRAKRLVGNFPQAFTHVALVNAARLLSAAVSPARPQ